MDSHPVLSRVQVSRHLVRWLEGEMHTLPSGIQVMAEHLGGVFLAVTVWFGYFEFPLVSYHSRERRAGNIS
jgi:hypothetical protein